MTRGDGLWGLWNRDLRTALDDKVYASTFWAIMLLGLVLRVLYLFRDMHFDESWTYVNYATQSFVDIIRTYDCTNNHILHTLLVALLTKIFGASPEVIRLPALFFGLLMIPLVYVVAAETYDRNAGILAAALTAVSSCLVEYSTNGRGYTMLVDMTLVSLYCGDKLLRDRRLSLWLTFGVLGAIGFFISPIMLYPYGGVALYLLLSFLAGDASYPKAQAMGRLALACGIGAVLTIVLYLPGLLSSQVFNQSHLQELPVGFLVSHYAQPYLSSLYLWTRDVPVAVSAVLIAMLAVSTVFTRKLAGRRIPVVLCALVWPVVVGVFYHVIPITRSLLYILPLAFITLAGCLVYAKRWLADAARLRTVVCAGSLALALVLSGFVVTRDSIPRSFQTGAAFGAKAAAAYIAGRYALSDGLFLSFTAVGPLEYYLFMDNVPYRWMKNQVRDRLWVVCNSTEDPEQLDKTLKDWGMQKPYKVLSQQTFKAVTVYEVALSPSGS